MVKPPLMIMYLTINVQMREPCIFVKDAHLQRGQLIVVNGSVARWEKVEVRPPHAKPK